MTLPETENLVKEFGSFVATDDANLTVEGDERVSIIGPNGAGKSALINPIMRRPGPTSGDIRFKGESIVGFEPHQVVQCGVSKSFQTASISPDLTIRKNAEVAALAAERGAFGFEFLRHRDSLTDVHGIARDTPGSAGLLDRADTIVTNLPYGGKRRLEAGIALASESNLLLMDEPTAGMFPEEMKSTVDLIEQVKHDYGFMFVLAGHDVEIVFSVSDCIVVLSHGGIITEGTPDEIRNNEAIQEACLGGVEL